MFFQNILAKGVEALPLIGPFAVGVLQTAPLMIYEKLEAKKIYKSANEKNDKLLEIGLSYIEKVVEEVGHELSIIYEFQIAAISSPTDVEKLAKYAAKRGFEKLVSTFRK